MAKCEKASAAATAARTPKWKNMYKDRYPNCRNYNFLSLCLALILFHVLMLIGQKWMNIILHSGGPIIGHLNRR